MIPEWLTFQNEFIPSIYISLYLLTWYRDEILFPLKSFWNEFIPVFNLNETQILVWHVISGSWKPKTNSVRRWNHKRCIDWGELVAHAYRFQDGRQRLWASRFCQVNAVQTSFWNETEMRLILVSCEQPLSDCSHLEYWKFFWQTWTGDTQHTYVSCISCQITKKLQVVFCVNSVTIHNSIV